jgi:uncharacterized SAM-binding protein YcdF (DUF218 family)
MPRPLALLLAATLLAACHDPEASGPADTTSGAGAAGAVGAAGNAGNAGNAGGVPEIPALDPHACAAQGPAGPPYANEYAHLASPSRLADRVFYLLTVLSQDTALAAALQADGAVSALGAARADRLQHEAHGCAGEPSCVRAAVVPAEADLQAMATTVTAALSAHGQIGHLATDHLRPAGDFNLRVALADEALFAAVWQDTFAALADAFDSHAASLPAAGLAAVVDGAAASTGGTAPWSPLLAVVLGAMAAQGRDEAVRHEPLDTGENAAALALIPTLDFGAYPFSAIVVPGQGPTDTMTALNPIGQKRCDLAVDRFLARQAPLIVLTGGHVHPDRTPYAEALEMKKYLVGERSIPPGRILVEPYARHTTTNLRDVARLAFRHGLPAARPLLVTSDLLQSVYIGYWDGDFGPRCDKELGYRPWRSLVPLSANDACWVPTTLALQVGATDALDP